MSWSDWTSVGRAHLKGRQAAMREARKKLPLDPTSSVGAIKSGTSDHPTLTTIQLSRRSLPLHLHTDKSDLLAGKREARTAWQCAEPKVLLDSFASVERRAQTRQRDSRRTRTGFLRQSTSVPVLSSRQLPFETVGLISMEFPVAKPRNIDAGRNGRLSRIGWLSIS